MTGNQEEYNYLSEVLPGLRQDAPVEFYRLAQLIDQEQFELLGSEEMKRESEQDGNLRLVYLMNDAVESFLVFEDTGFEGSYDREYEGPLKAELKMCHEAGMSEACPNMTSDKVTHRTPSRYTLQVAQGEKTGFTIHFSGLRTEMHLFDYGHTGHFWVEGYEYLRQLEYKIAIVSDKLDYLGPDSCTETERQFAELDFFPPLNFNSYPAAPMKYVVPKTEAWVVTEEAILFMQKLAREVGDTSMSLALNTYAMDPSPKNAQKIARMLHLTAHQKLVKYLKEMIETEASTYPRREYDQAREEEHLRLRQKADEVRQSLQKGENPDDLKGVSLLYGSLEANVPLAGNAMEIWEELPFVTTEDEMSYKVFLMIWKKDLFNTKTDILRIEAADD